MRNPAIQQELNALNAKVTTLALGLLDNRVPAEGLMTTLPEEPARPLVLSAADMAYPDLRRFNFLDGKPAHDSRSLAEIARSVPKFTLLLDEMS